MSLNFSMDTLYISDLDGTLVNDRAELSAFSRDNLNNLLDDGLPFTIATARSIVSIQQMLNGLRLNLPVICFNGAFVSNFSSGRHDIVNTIQPEIARSIFTLAASLECSPYIASVMAGEERVYYSTVSNAGMKWYLDDRILRKDPRLRKIDQLVHGCNDPVSCLTIINRKPVLDELQYRISDTFHEHVELHNFENPYSPGWHWLTVHDRLASKDQAIRRLQQLTGHSKSKLVVFGDNHNDIKMFRFADHAVAVANAPEEVKFHAQEVIGSNLDDSVVRYLMANWPGAAACSGG